MKPLRPRNPTRRLVLEPLEDRRLLSNYLILDLTPDRVAREGAKPSSFASAFSLTDGNGYAPRFLDMNGDGYVDSTDVSQAAKQITNRTRQLFTGQNITVARTDLWADSDQGTQWLSYGQRSRADHVDVLYVGGYDSEVENGATGAWGIAFQAPVGYNNEYYAYAFTSEIVSWMIQYEPDARPRDFVNEVAKTVAHEAGHLLGLGHVRRNPAGDTNIMNYNSDAATANFPDKWYSAIDLLDRNYNSYWGTQNPAKELRDSLGGQPEDSMDNAVYSAYHGTVHFRVTPEELHGDHDHGGGAVSELTSVHVARAQGSGPFAFVPAAPRSEGVRSMVDAIHDAAIARHLQQDSRLPKPSNGHRVPDPTPHAVRASEAGPAGTAAELESLVGVLV